MSYTPHHFAPGDILYASELNEMDLQIQENAEATANALLWAPQSLTEEQRQQARKNLGTLSRLEIETLLSGEAIQREEITFETQSGGYWNKSGGWTADTGLTGMRTNLIRLTRGDCFAYSGDSRYNIPSVIWFDEGENVLFHQQWSNPQGGTILYKAPDNAAFARFYSFSYGGEPKMEVWYLPTGDKRQVNVETKEGGYWNWANSWVADSNYSGSRTNPIRVCAGDTFYYTGADYINIYGSVFYGEDGSIVERGMYSGEGILGTHKITPPEGAVVVRFFSCNATLAVSYENDGSDASAGVSNSSLSRLRAMNPLWGKKYVACGDSFTQGDFTNYRDENGNSGADSDAYDPGLGLYKTYPWWIAERNRMVLVNEALCGSTMYSNGSENAFSVSRYTKIPRDADYVTLCFGLNETGAPLGTLEDSTNETVMGAWNMVLEYLITNLPYARIGIIIPDAWCTGAMREALIQVAEYWGIPWLDLTGDPRVPLLIGGRREGTVCARAAALRNAAFQISDTDSHPNLKAHEYRSTIVEHFLRSL